MDAYTEFAELFKSRDNSPGYTPIFGTILELPNLKIRCGNKIWLDSSDVVSIFDICAVMHNEDGTEEYRYLNKTVVLLPYNHEQRFIAIGVITE